MEDILLLELAQILEIMEFYHRTEGYMDKVNGRLQFFDSDPCIGGVHACKITKDEVKQYIGDYPRKESDRVQGTTSMGMPRRLFERNTYNR